MLAHLPSLTNRDPRKQLIRSGNLLAIDILKKLQRCEGLSLLMVLKSDRTVMVQTVKSLGTDI